jgi:hypothetical protein
MYEQYIWIATNDHSFHIHGEYGSFHRDQVTGFMAWLSRRECTIASYNITHPPTYELILFLPIDTDSYRVPFRRHPKPSQPQGPTMTPSSRYLMTSVGNQKDARSGRRVKSRRKARVESKNKPRYETDNSGEETDNSGNKTDDLGDKTDDSGNKTDDSGNEGDSSGNKTDDSGNERDVSESKPIRKEPNKRERLRMERLDMTRSNIDRIVQAPIWETPSLQDPSLKSEKHFADVYDRWKQNLDQTRSKPHMGD